MALAAGSKLGPYEVIALIGAGGMGEVYRARDPRLGRDVAIKVLPADRVADEDRRRRFVQEAKAASALNHPHIVTIYEIESANGADFIVMEYVSGKSLDALIPRHGLRLGEVLRIAIPVADALAAAHARDIIHRDLKPANVMVGSDGAVKVLDFGLAKLIGREDADEADLTHTADVGLSVPGTIAGTAAYMSPEQATGGKVDARSDIFSFGALLYEMVTGVRAFAGTSMTGTLSAVVRAQPKPPTAIVPSLPLDLEKIILRCLRKDPERRFQHIADVKVALQEVKEDSESGLGATASRSGPSRHRRVAALLGLLALLLTAAVWMMLRSRAAVEAPMRVTTLTTMPGAEGWPTFSPGGEQVAFSWQGESGRYGGGNVDIYVAMVGSSEVRRLTTDPWADYAPSWSPDGQQIAFQHGDPRQGADRIHLVSPLGGTDRKLSDLPTGGPTSWSKDGNFIAAARWRSSTSPTDSAGIYLVPIHGGEPRPLTHPVPPLQDFAPSFSPDGHRLAYASCNDPSGCDLEVLDLDAALNAQGPARRLMKNSIESIGGCAWTRDGKSVIFGTAGPGNTSQLWRVGVDGTGPPERIEIAGQGATAPATVPSRDWLAFSREEFDSDIYMLQLGRGSHRVQASSSFDTQAQFSPDGRRITFCSSRSGEEIQVWVAALDGSEAHQLTHDLGRWQCSPHWSPDGRRIAFDSRAANGQWHIWIMDADGGPARQITTDSGSQNIPTWSHDGQWIYFAWGQGNHRDIWRTKTDGGPHERITHGGTGMLGLESADGKSLLYQAYDDRDAPLLSQPLSGGAAREVLKCIDQGGGFFPARNGIYYAACALGADAEVHLLQPETGEDKRIGTLEKLFRPYFGLAVSPDGTQILYGQQVRAGSDLMLIENFR